MRKALFSLPLAIGLTLSACTTILNNLPGVYVLEIQQGNIIDQAMINQLKPNMDKRQVLYVMGSPMLADYFHKNRWEYVYTDKKKGEELIEKKVSLEFKPVVLTDSNGQPVLDEYGKVKTVDRLAGVYGDFKPMGAAGLKPNNDKIVDVPKRRTDFSYWGTITSLFGFGEESADEATNAEKEKAEDKAEAEEAASGANSGFWPF